MADRPLRPATHRRLGRPLPHQQANAPRAHPNAEAEASFRPKTTSGISPSFLGLSRSLGQVTHVLLTRSRLCPGASPGSSLHLHVLSTPPAFVLSQDQTLREELHKERLAPLEAPPVHRGRRGRLTGLLLSTTGTSDSLCRPALGSAAGITKPGRTPMARSHQVRMLLSFQRPPRLRGGDSAGYALRSLTPERAVEFSAPD